jgi:hypothetical protein
MKNRKFVWGVIVLMALAYVAFMSVAFLMDAVGGENLISREILYYIISGITAFYLCIMVIKKITKF